MEKDTKAPAKKAVAKKSAAVKAATKKVAAAAELHEVKKGPAKKSEDTPQLPWLEVHPETAPTVEGQDIKWQYRLKGANGKHMLYSGSEGFNKARAIRAAKQFNETVAQGRLEIRVLDFWGERLDTIAPSS